MAHGLKPYGRTAAENTIFGIQDMRELAASLWSIRTFDGRGNILFMEGFEASLNKWRPQIAGAATNAISNARARSGLLSLHMTAASAIADGRQTAIHEEPYPVLSSFGHELSVSGFDNVIHFEVGLLIYFAGDYRPYHIRWTQATNILEYYNAAGGWTQIDVEGVPVVHPLRGDPTLFHTIKLVVDGIGNLYRYVIVDNAQYSLAGIVPDTVGTPLGDHLRISYTVEGEAPNVAEIWVDDVILTQNEP